MNNKTNEDKQEEIEKEVADKQHSQTEDVEEKKDWEVIAKEWEENCLFWL